MSRYYDNSATYVEPVVAFKMDEHSISFVPPPIEPLMSECLYNGSESCIHLGCDISIIFNQERITKELAPIVEEWFTSHSSDLSDRYKNLTDAEIISCIKSRYIQRPSEIQNWTAYLTAELDAIVKEKQSQKNENPVPEAPQSIESNTET